MNDLCVKGEEPLVRQGERIDDRVDVTAAFDFHAGETDTAGLAGAPGERRRRKAVEPLPQFGEESRVLRRLADGERDTDRRAVLAIPPELLGLRPVLGGAALD